MSSDRPYVERNTRERERMRALIARASDDDLRRKVNEHWTVAGVLLHIAFWDRRALWLADKIARGEPFTPSEVEPDDPSWINDTTRTFLHAIAPREAANLALGIAEETDARVAAIDPAKTWPSDETSLLNPVRAEHRQEHLEEIEAALAGREPPRRDR
jgi:sulfite reductase beta subunit-like hemoprotein